MSARAVVLCLAAVLAAPTLTACESAEDKCAVLGGHIKEHTETGVGPNLNGKGGVAVTVSTTYFCLSDDGRILEVY